jgi:DNA/RNA endonuclease YhcR with UshA esterase domain
MNKRKITVTIVLLVFIIATVAVGAETYEPGSKEDPVVTKSYVDSQIAALKSDDGTISPETFKAVEVKKGKRLIGSGGTELILRSGEALAIDNGADGLSDLTGAKDLKEGMPVIKNHHIIVPRDDGRGISASTDLWVMVKGDYSIK